MSPVEVQMPCDEEYTQNQTRERKKIYGPNEPRSLSRVAGFLKRSSRLERSSFRWNSPAATNNQDTIESLRVRIGKTHAQDAQLAVHTMKEDEQDWLHRLQMRQSRCSSQQRTVGGLGVCGLLGRCVRDRGRGGLLLAAKVHVQTAVHREEEEHLLRTRRGRQCIGMQVKCERGETRENMADMDSDISVKIDWGRNADRKKNIIERLLQYVSL